ncbi:glycosyltransferase family 2 protein [bacterium]|nr:glycosyltransferase family 2 protein [bacterium]
MNDLISVIIPVKNGSKYLSQALDGILQQNMDVEIIVVDDCSDDDTVKIAEKYGCKIIRHDTSKGPVIAKNNGLKIAAGKYILFHDHDDIMRDGVLQKLYEEITSENDIYAVEAKVQDFYSPELSEEEREKTPIKSEPYWGLFTGAILMRKDTFDKIGLFSETLRAGEIIEWQSKMDSANLKIKKIDIVSTDRRIHSTNFGKMDKKAEFRDYAAILRAKLAAKR